MSVYLQLRAPAWKSPVKQILIVWLLSMQMHVCVCARAYVKKSDHSSTGIHEARSTQLSNTTGIYNIFCRHKSTRIGEADEEVLVLVQI